MTPRETHPTARDPYQAGFEDGLKAVQSVAPADLETVALARALDSLARHAATQADDDLHVACLECETMVLLARLVGFGDLIRAQEKRQRDQS